MKHIVVLVLAFLGGVAQGADPPRFGTYEHLFAADSQWNSRPLEPVLGNDVVPKADYAPDVSAGPWSTGLFLARDGDPPMTIYGVPGKPGVWDVDAEDHHDVTIPHWPAELAPASAADGHADIVDLSAGVVHSFWQLKKVGDRWTASLYAWTPLAGRGWGDPAHYYQGARAAAVPASAGLIRKQEIDDGDSMYRHALAVSLTYNALSAKPTYVFPATSADHDAASTNKGTIPEGALLMLPASFDAQALARPALRKIAETLKVYGAYVVDRNVGTPFVVYVEIGSGFSLHKGQWDNAAAADLDRIRAALRPVVSTKGFVDGNGKRFVPERKLNLLSMRGPWKRESGDRDGRFDTLAQAVVFPAGATKSVQFNDSGRAMQPVSWATPETGKRYRLTSVTTGGALLHVQLRDRTSGRILYDSGELPNGTTKSIVWPADAGPVTFAISGVDGPSSVRGTLMAE